MQVQPIFLNPSKLQIFCILSKTLKNIEILAPFPRNSDVKNEKHKFEK